MTRPLLRKVTPSTWDAVSLTLAAYCLAEKVGALHFLAGFINP